jgi:hypothetical protein
MLEHEIQNPKQAQIAQMQKQSQSPDALRRKTKPISPIEQAAGTARPKDAKQSQFQRNRQQPTGSRQPPPLCETNPIRGSIGWWRGPTVQNKANLRAWFKIG